MGSEGSSRPALRTYFIGFILREPQSTSANFLGNVGEGRGGWLPDDVVARARLSMRIWEAPIRGCLRFFGTRRRNLPRKVLEAATYVKLCVV